MHQIKTAASMHHGTGQSLKGHDSGGRNTLFQDWEAQVRKNLHAPQCFPSWFIEHHLHCYTNNNALLGDDLELEQTTSIARSSPARPDCSEAARPMCNCRTKPGSTLSS